MRPQPVGVPSLKATQSSADRSYLTSIVSAAAILLAIFVVASTVYGVYHFYSPVPFWDEWDGCIGFYRATIENGGFWPWWFNHAEHRILTAKVLFWLDIRYFQGNHIILFGTILVMLAGIVAIVSALSRHAPKAWTVGLGCALMFAWVQHEVLTWGFEIPVTAVYFFAIAACALFCRFDWPAPKRYLLAYTAAILSEFSMGNGIGVYVLFFGATILARRPMIERVATAVLGAILISVYFIRYVWPPAPEVSAAVDHGIVFKAGFISLFMANPLAVAGAPFGLCIVIGAIMLIAAIATGLHIYWTRSATPYRTFLICIYVFVLFSAVAVTKDRSFGGYGAAIASRYTTGALLSWWVLALLLYDYLRASFARGAVMVISIALAAVVSIGQFPVATDNGYLYGWKLAVLSNRIGLERPDLVSQIFPQDPVRAARFEANTAYAATHHVGYYESQWLRDASQVKFDPSKLESGWCAGNLDSVNSDAQGPTASGWASSPAGNDALIVLTDAQGETVGYGVTGTVREDVNKAVPGAPKLPGWNGFAQPGKAVANAYVYANERFCKLSSTAK